MKKIIIALCVVLAVFAVGYNAYQSEKQEKASDKKTVLVVIPVTGNISVWSDYFIRGIEYFKAKHPNSKIQVKILDTQSNNMAMISGLQQEFMKGKPYALVVPFSPFAVPASTFAAKENVYTIGMACSNKILENKTVQRVYVSSYDGIKPLADYLKKKYKTLAILHGNDEGSISDVDILVKEYKSDDNEVVLRDTFEISNNDIHTMVHKLLKDKPEAIFTEGYGKDFWKIIYELKSLNYPGAIASNMAFNDQEQIKDLGRHAEGVIFMGSPADVSQSDIPAVQEMANFFEEKYGKPLHYLSVLIYEALAILDETAQKDLPPSRETFEKMKEFNGIVGTLQFLQNGDMKYPWIPVTIKDGKIIPVEESEEK